MNTLSRELIIELGEIIKEESGLDLDFNSLEKLATFLVEYFKNLLVE